MASAVSRTGSRLETQAGVQEVFPGDADEELALLRADSIKFDNLMGTTSHKMLDESMKTYERDKGLREKHAVAEFGNVLRRADKENLGLVEEATETYEESFEPLEEKVKKMMTQSSRNTAKLEAADEDVALLNELQREGATLLEETLRDQRSYSKKVRKSAVASLKDLQKSFSVKQQKAAQALESEMDKGLEQINEKATIGKDHIGGKEREATEVLDVRVEKTKPKIDEYNRLQKSATKLSNSKVTEIDKKVNELNAKALPRLRKSISNFFHEANVKLLALKTAAGDSKRDAQDIIDQSVAEQTAKRDAVLQDVEKEPRSLLKKMKRDRTSAIDYVDAAESDVRESANQAAEDANSLIQDTVGLNENIADDMDGSERNIADQIAAASSMLDSSREKRKELVKRTNQKLGLAKTRNADRVQVAVRTVEDEADSMMEKATRHVAAAVSDAQRKVEQSITNLEDASTSAEGQVAERKQQLAVRRSQLEEVIREARAELRSEAALAQASSGELRSTIKGASADAQQAYAKIAQSVGEKAQAVLEDATARVDGAGAATEADLTAARTSGAESLRGAAAEGATAAAGLLVKVGDAQTEATSGLGGLAEELSRAGALVEEQQKTEGERDADLASKFDALEQQKTEGERDA